ncbi:hypothetical protein IFR05_014292 [Cadophora sp. M221]|nr:hypothetical protein IFR05_014292 [Cadophora sp. M221]
MSPITPFTIDIEESKLHRLRQKLDLTDFPPELDQAGSTYGAPLSDVTRLVKHWKHGFDWRTQEAKLNELPQFTTNITVNGFGELNIHFVHQRSDVANAIPLLFIHGWPGSFIEVTNLLPLLRGSQDEPAFHVVAPSLPNFGFSSRVSKKGFGISQYAEACNKLMLALGYDQYVVQGGDWGSIILRALGHYHSDHARALHTNMVLAGFPKPLNAPFRFVYSLTKHALSGFLPTYTTSESESLARAIDWRFGSGRGYFAQMATKPQTIGYSLADSPVGLLAWIYEKLMAWTDDYPWTDDEILTWVSIYYFSTAGPSAASFIYFESQASNRDMDSTDKLQAYVDLPIGLAYFPKEIANMPRMWAEGLGKVIHVSESSKGGHFAALERPDVISDDLKTMFGKGGKAFGVVDGKSGY